MTNRGQAFVEMILASGIGILVFAGLLSAIYWLSLRIYSSYYLYESLVCNVHSTVKICEMQLKTQIKKFPLTENMEIDFIKKQSRKSYQIEAHLRVKNSYCKHCKVLDVKDSVYVPKTYR
jgi:hypothetical protein